MCVCVCVCVCAMYNYKKENEIFRMILFFTYDKCLDF